MGSFRTGTRGIAAGAGDLSSGARVGAAGRTSDLGVLEKGAADLDRGQTNTVGSPPVPVARAETHRTDEGKS